MKARVELTQDEVKAAVAGYLGTVGRENVAAADVRLEVIETDLGRRITAIVEKGR